MEKYAVGSKLISFFGLENSWEKWVEITPSSDIQIQTFKGSYTLDITNRSGKGKDVGGSPVCQERLIPRSYCPWTSSPMQLLKELLDFSLVTLMCLVQEQTHPSSSTPCLSGLTVLPNMTKTLKNNSKWVSCEPSYNFWGIWYMPCWDVVVSQRVPCKSLEAWFPCLHSCLWPHFPSSRISPIPIWEESSIAAEGVLGPSESEHHSVWSTWWLWQQAAKANQDWYRAGNLLVYATRHASCLPSH